jgi:hypothetical protein
MVSRRRRPQSPSQGQTNTSRLAFEQQLFQPRYVGFGSLCQGYNFRDIRPKSAPNSTG